MSPDGELGPRNVLASALGLDTPQDLFPWQARLLEEWFLAGRIPSAVDIPTGLGKTAVMAIWLVARALGGSLPRRLVYVVDRRAVVDQATTEAERLRDHVEANGWLKQRLGLSMPLAISTLRGQFVDNRQWLEDPAAPAIVVGTVDMVGSRLLFSGYGVSRKMRPYHAGLLGADTLVVLDEAHLVPPFQHLLRAIEKDPALRSEVPEAGLPPPFRLLPLSATARADSAGSGCVIRLTDEDHAHPVVRRRLHAKKALRLRDLDAGTKLEDALAQEAWRIAGQGERAARVLIYSNSRDVATRAKKAVEKLAKGDRKAGKAAGRIDTELFVGARRVFEREEAKQRLKDLGFLAGSDVQRTKPVFLFATSAGEVGVDLDADHMVSDLVAWERMVQRLGRVNRRGDGDASVTVFVRGEDDDASRLRTPFAALPSNDDGTHDASPAALSDLQKRAASDEELRKILGDATSPEPLRPCLTRPLVEAWAMTSLEKHTGRPDVQPWLRGWVEDPPQTAVVWRTHLPVRSGGSPVTKKEIEEFFEAAPPHTSEILETETSLVAKWIASRASKLRNHGESREDASAEPRLRDEDVAAFVLEPDGSLREKFRLEDLATRDRKELREALAGATLVVDAHIAGLVDGLLDEKHSEPPRTADDGGVWLTEGLTGFRVRRVEGPPPPPDDPNWRERFRFPAVVNEDGEADSWLVVDKWRHDAATEEDRSASHPQLLDEHEAWTEDRARRLGRAIGLGPEDVEALALAARLHDEGKRAARWQRAFHAPEDGVYAKTRGPIDYRLLDGYRHELGSLLRIENDDRLGKLTEERRDLVLHLVAAHHGFARPVIATSGCEDAPPSALEKKATEIARRFARLQDRLGPWGLAWWEALLRAADQQASRDNDARAAAPQVPAAQGAG